ncbi:hypothetical protein [Cryobacterium sp. Y57]|uniref:hypothetical protein n=1 Tax=Cryobacterium sp. Y57 TaxID=2048287 RepID=UPI000CE48D9E|nr:hypothetical protein [Cryobacterium sp. Y57]
MDAGNEAGGILGLLGLVEDHTEPLARDFRERFGLSYLEIGYGIVYIEAWHLCKSLLKDPSSWLHAAVAGWEHPVSREWIILAQSFDLAHAAASKHRPKPMPRPWPDTKNKIGGKKMVRRSIEDVRAILRPQSTE